MSAADSSRDNFKVKKSKFEWRPWRIYIFKPDWRNEASGWTVLIRMLYIPILLFSLIGTANIAWSSNNTGDGNSPNTIEDDFMVARWAASNYQWCIHRVKDPPTCRYHFFKEMPRFYLDRMQ